MKLRAGVLFISILISLASLTQEKNPDAFLYQVFTTIKNNDTSSFVNLFIDYQQMKSLMVETVLTKKDTTNNSRVLEFNAGYSEKQYEEDVIKVTKKQFSAFRSKVVTKGIDPASLIFDSCRYEERIPERFENQRLFDGTIFLNYGEEACRIPFIANWLETQKGWISISLIDFLKKGEALPGRDSMVSVTDTVFVETV